MSTEPKLSPAGNVITTQPEVLPATNVRWTDIAASLRTAEVRALQSERLYKARAWSGVLKALRPPEEVKAAVKALAEATKRVDGFKSKARLGTLTANDVKAAQTAAADVEAHKATIAPWTGGKASGKRKAHVAVESLRQGVLPIRAALTSAASALTLRDIKAERAALDKAFDDSVNALSTEERKTLPAGLLALLDGNAGPLSK